MTPRITTCERCQTPVKVMGEGTTYYVPIVSYEVLLNILVLLYDYRVKNGIKSEDLDNTIAAVRDALRAMEGDAAKQ